MGDIFTAACCGRSRTPASPLRPRPRRRSLRVTDTVQVDAQRGWRMLLRRTAALLAGETAARAIGFAVVVLLARRLGPSGFGVVTLGLTLVTFFAYIVDSGTELLNVREVARTPSRFRE